MKLCPFFLSINPKPRQNSAKSVFSVVLIGIITVLNLSLSTTNANAQTFTERTLHTFTNNSDGGTPLATLIHIGDTLYGTTLTGGTNAAGTLFAINTDGTGFQSLYSFQGRNFSGLEDGDAPRAGLLNIGGTLYGTTPDGGMYGYGTVFSFNLSSHVEVPIYSFKDGSLDGNYPQDSLIALNGTLYGTTSSGGANGRNGPFDGTVFSLNTDGSNENVLYSIIGSAAHGGHPTAGLIEVDGRLYGTIQYGGTHDAGTIFSMNPDGSDYQTLYNFTGDGTNSDGADPKATLLEVNGILFGTTASGGTSNYGTVFRINTDGTGYQALYSFKGGDSDGAAPYASLIAFNGLLFGTTDQGGPNNNGTVFCINTDGSHEKLIYNFQNGSADGTNPFSGLVAVDGILYGTTAVGGQYASGTVYSLTPAAPIAGNDRYTPKYQTAYAVKAPGVLANDNNSGNGAITASLVSNPAHGTLTLNSDGSFTYTPANGFVGTDSFNYQDIGVGGHSNIATVSLVIQTSAPVAHNDAYFPTYSHAYKVNAPGVLANDYAGDNSTLTASLVSTVSHGTLTFNPDGSFLYTATFGYSGTDSFTYKDTNAIGTSNTATVTLTIYPVVPIAHNDAYAPKYQTAYGVSAPGALGNDDTGGTTPMTAALVANVTHGTLTFNSNGSFTYTPSVGFVGTDTFTYQDTTPTGTGNIATVSLNVTAAVPVAHNDAYTVTHNKTFVVHAPGILANDYAGDSGAFAATLVTSAAHGTLTFSSDGSFVYTPSAGFSGTDTFTYKDTNAIGTSSTATVTLTVQ